MSKHQPDFTSVSYWDSRYADEDSHEWLGHGCYQATLDRIVNEHGDKNATVLVLGCGNSRLSVDLYDLGYHHIVSTDISSTCIEKQRSQQGSSRPGLKWQVADMTDLKEFDDESFDLVIEKATIDAFLANERSQWNPSERSRRLVHRTLQETFRVLKMNGDFISISFSQPHFRKPLIERSKMRWSVICNTLRTSSDSFHYYFYKMTKGKEQRSGYSPKLSRPNIIFHSDVSSDEESEEFLQQICI